MPAHAVARVDGLPGGEKAQTVPGDDRSPSPAGGAEHEHLASSFNPSPLGQSVTFTATVRSRAAATPTGSVTFSVGAEMLGVVPLDSRARSAALIPTDQRPSAAEERTTQGEARRPRPGVPGLTVLLAVSCSSAGRSQDPGGGVPAPPAVSGGEGTVVIRNVSYNPERLTVPAGREVVWVFDDTGLTRSPPTTAPSTQAGRRPGSSGASSTSRARSPTTVRCTPG
ncbi:MAG: hypothetical protein ACRDH5_00200 [bacterium]